MRIDVRDQSAVGEVRRCVTALAHDAGLDEISSGRAALAAVELSTNILRHARSGFVLLQVAAAPEPRGIEILAVDSGPGMQDTARCLADGYSTAGTSGTGLGGVQRSATEFDIYSQPGKGTVVLCRIEEDRGIATPYGSRVVRGSIAVPLHAQDPCGDACATHDSGPRTMAIMADGLGHGIEAARAANTAIALFRRHSPGDPAQLATTVHAGLRATRGAAIGIAALDLGRRIIRYCGIGNITTKVYDGKNFRQLMTHNGTAGAEALKIMEYTYPWPERGILVMHSDGVAMHWSLDSYPGLTQRHPAVIAAVLYRDFARGTDDASLLVLKERLSP